MKVDGVKEHTSRKAASKFSRNKKTAVKVNTMRKAGSILSPLFGKKLKFKPPCATTTSSSLKERMMELIPEMIYYPSHYERPIMKLRQAYSSTTTYSRLINKKLGQTEYGTKYDSDHEDEVTIQ